MGSYYKPVSRVCVIPESQPADFFFNAVRRGRFLKVHHVARANRVSAFHNKSCVFMILFPKFRIVFRELGHPSHFWNPFCDLLGNPNCQRMVRANWRTLNRTKTKAATGPARVMASLTQDRWPQTTASKHEEDLD